MSLEKQIRTVQKRLEVLHRQCKQLARHAKHYLELQDHCHFIREGLKRYLAELRQQKSDRKRT